MVPEQQKGAAKKCHACILKRALEAQVGSALTAVKCVFAHKFARGDASLEDWPGTPEEMFQFCAELLYDSDEDEDNPV